MPGQQYTPPSYPPPPAGPPAMGGYSSPSYPPAASGSAPPVYAPPSYPPSGLPASAATPQSASSSAAGGKPGPLVPLLGRFAKQKWVQDFLTLPPARRLRVLRVSAAAFGCAVLLLLLLLLWPHRVPIIVRSNPDQAEVFRNGESLGKTPLVIEIQKGAEEKLVLRKSGYEETTQEIKGGGEKVVLVTLEETGSGKPAGSPTDKPQVPQKPPTTANPPTEPSPPVKPPATGTSPSTAEKPHPQAPQEAAEEGGDNSGDTGAKSDSGDETKKKKKKKKKKVVVF